MKKVFAIAAIGGLFLASCKGDYHCHCMSNGVELEADYEGVKKDDAQTSCDAYLAELRNVDPNATCELEEGEH